MTDIIRPESRAYTYGGTSVEASTSGDSYTITITGENIPEGFGDVMVTRMSEKGYIKSPRVTSQPSTITLTYPAGGSFAERSKFCAALDEVMTYAAAASRYPQLPWEDMKAQAMKDGVEQAAALREKLRADDVRDAEKKGLPLMTEEQIAAERERQTAIAAETRKTRGQEPLPEGFEERLEKVREVAMKRPITI